MNEFNNFDIISSQLGYLGLNKSVRTHTNDYYDKEDLIQKYNFQSKEELDRYLNSLEEANFR